MKEITIVTAFFNINRSNWGKFTRTNDNYLEYFSQWAKMKNKLIVFVETAELAEKVMAIRENYNLKDKTIINIISDYTKVDKELYESIKKATEHPIQKEFRFSPNNPEVWNYNYSYVMLLKMWCVQSAIDERQATGMVAWVDFGYNHGGDVIDRNSNFSFTWRYDFPNKINLFSVKELDDRPIFDIVRSMDTYIMGTVIAGPSILWKEFWLLMRTAMMNLNYSGLTDDDQTILLLAYRMNSELFNIYPSGWQLPIKQYGGDHLLLTNNKKKENNTIKYYLRKTPIRKVVKEFRETKLSFKYSFKIFKRMQKSTRS